MKQLDLSFLQNELNRTADWIQFADKKSAFLSVYYSGIFLALINYRSTILCSISNYKGWFLLFYKLLIIANILLFILGIYFLFKSIFPRLNNKNTDKSMFYFGHISKLKLIDYYVEMEKLTKKESKKQISEQIYTNSIIIDQKMRNVKHASKCLFVLVIFLFLLIII